MRRSLTVREQVAGVRGRPRIGHRARRGSSSSRLGLVVALRGRRPTMARRSPPRRPGAISTSTSASRELSDLAVDARRPSRSRRRGELVEHRCVLSCRLFCGRMSRKYRKTSARMITRKLTLPMRWAVGGAREPRACKLSNAPRSIARARRRVRSSRKRRLCRRQQAEPEDLLLVHEVADVRPREARARGARAAPSSGRGSRAKRAFRRFSRPSTSARCRCAPCASAGRSRTCRCRARSPRGCPRDRRCP